MNHLSQANVTERPSFANLSISGSTLKIIALLCMLADHIGAVLLEPSIIAHEASAPMLTAYVIMRFLIGRAAFPIYCFLLVEGFIHTSDVKKYVVRLLLFAFISEPAFDLATSRNFFSLGHQNVFFTLFLGIIALNGYQTVEVKLNDQQKNKVCVILYGFILAVTMLVADLLCVDYGSVGILTISFLYFFKKNRKCVILKQGKEQHFFPSK